ncbi:MAG: hypothetical protein HY319_14085 [Armatimonadetes bacterium]|nr:hypothetical protein [Armatimonadota bacterium]
MESAPTRERRCWMAGFLFFAALLIFNLAYHSMWGDELQAWGIARASSDPVELFENLRYEGHPMLWHLVLWPASQWTGDPRAMQAIHASLALAWLALVWFRSPFTLAERILLSSSHYLVYEYAVVSRCYGLGVLLMFLFVVWRQDFSRRPWAGWLLLGLLANTQMFLALAALSLGGLWLWIERSRGRDVLSGISIFVLLLAFAGVTMARGNVSTTLQTRPVVVFTDALDTFCDAFAPLEDPRNGRYWKPGMERVPSLVAGALVLGLIVLYLRRQPAGLLAFFFLVGSMTVFFCIRYHGSSWHGGIAFVTLVSLVWLLRDDGRRLGPVWAFWLILALNLAGGLKSVVASKHRPLSTSREAARWIHEHELQDEFWIAYPAFPGFGAGTYLDRPVYFPEAHTEGRYVRWGEHELFRIWDLPGEVERLLALRELERVHLITNYDLLNGRWRPPHELDRRFHVVELARFRNADDDLERFILYRVERRDSLSVPAGNVPGTAQ